PTTTTNSSSHSVSMSKSFTSSGLSRGHPPRARTRSSSRSLSFFANDRVFSIGTGRVARAEPDGYTLILGTVATHVFNAAAYALKYDVAKDFDPVSLIAFDPQIIAVRKEFPATDLTQLIAWLKANPDKATAGTAGVGSTSHISAVSFQKITGTQFGFVPYRGLGPAMHDLVSGHIDVLFDLAANAVPQVRADSIRG